MTLTPWDMADLDKLAFETCEVGKQHAGRAYKDFARSRGWGQTPAWVAGRGYFLAQHRKARTALLEAQAAVVARVREQHA